MADEKDTVNRIKKDIELFTKNIKEIDSIELNENEIETIERAKSYFEDTDYYLKKQDLITSFGCITYAHGLLDAIRLIHGLI
ncbi:MAG: DUF357 domain-containing protein [Methanobacterium sp.]|nr:DUF357 domain-containing protein [Methanobacterium sp.]